MEMKMHAAYRWMAWGTFCTAIHFKMGDIQVLPPYVGFAMVTVGMYGIWKCAESKGALKGEEESGRVRLTGRVLMAVLTLLVLASLWGTVMEHVNLVDLLPDRLYGLAVVFNSGFWLLLLTVLEFGGYLTGMSLMKRCGARVGIWRVIYLVAEAAAVVLGTYGILTLTPAYVVLMAVNLMIGRMVFFFLVWGESRKAEVSIDG